MMNFFNRHKPSSSSSSPSSASPASSPLSPISNSSTSTSLSHSKSSTGLLRKKTSPFNKRSFSPARFCPILNSKSNPSFQPSSSLTTFSNRIFDEIIMGQQNSRPEYDPVISRIQHPPSAFSSPGPDPFHHAPPTHKPLQPAPPGTAPAFYHAPHSAPVVPVSTRPKGLIRSLSAKRRGESRFRDAQNNQVEPELPPIGSLKALKTLGATQGFDLKSSMKEFEALVQRAEADAGIRSPSPTTVNDIKSEVSSTFPRRSLKSHHKRESFSGESFSRFREGSNSPLPKLLATPAYLRSTPYRRNSCSSSIHSSRVSIKSAKRAEREWRAKVAALSSGLTPQSTLKTSPDKPTTKRKGGPVPPRRTNHSTSPGVYLASMTSRSTSPEEGTVIITPPHSSNTAVSFGTPLSNKSFETLGHYPNSSIIDSPTPASNHGDARERKPSVPHSAYSSTCSTIKDEEETGRPISFASGQWLAPSTLQPSPLKVQIKQEIDNENELYTPTSLSANGTSTPSSPHQDNLPPFDSFKSSPRMVTSAALPILETPRKPVNINREAEEVERKHQSLPSPPRPNSSTTPTRRPSLHVPMLNIPNTPPCLPPLTFSPSSAGLVTPTNKIMSTPIKSNSATIEPSTPYSPTTAYILSAPSPSIDQLAYSNFVNSPEKPNNDRDPITPIKKHPFTFGAKPSPEVLNRATPEEEDDNVPTRHTEAGTEAGWVGMVIPRRSSIDPFIPRQLPSTRISNTALRPKGHIQNIPSMKFNAIGNNAREEAGLKRLMKAKVDLTPGMDNGCRPPKSGLPMADLERWLRTKDNHWSVLNAGFANVALMGDAVIRWKLSLPLFS
ncbi:uncharacterized protein I303_105700 [Kwoniella dejecticola CBS 10117]|uniref:Uncharacterized protein n=1 Tax=Kwoniella dejecticola CBS 10117 TaxID=1296121 RepID=A0A1A6A056_9TREE|nr:uncharacterized protein I303_05721 [Kwoniella dejecticola CBS 10117]OBR83443.1 hypothetical protein I303_05721 [Kwoniella dejecticola CBS 10117]